MATLDAEDIQNIKAAVQQALTANNAGAAEAVWQRVGSSSETMGKKLGDIDNRAQNIEAAVGGTQTTTARIEQKLDAHIAAG